MTIAVKIRAKVTGRRRGTGLEVELPLAPGQVSAHELIAAAVRAEVAAHERRADEATLVRMLTARELTEDLTRGAVRMGDAERSAPIDVEHAVATALLAFEDGIFKVFVGEQEVDPGSAVDLSDGADVLFLRLVPLAGG